MPKEQSSEELSSLAAQVLQMDERGESTEGAGAFNRLLRIAKRLAGSVLSQDETPKDESDCGA